MLGVGVLLRRDRDDDESPCNSYGLTNRPIHVRDVFQDLQRQDAIEARLREIQVAWHP